MLHHGMGHVVVQDPPKGTMEAVVMEERHIPTQSDARALESKELNQKGRLRQKPGQRNTVKPLRVSSIDPGK